VKYNASSPDELALVNAGRAFGYFFCERDTENNMIVRFGDGSTEKYKLLNVIEFDSARKRMTVIVQTPENEIKVMCKGADSIIYPRLKTRDDVEATQKYLESYASEGLRTLLLAEKTISLDEYDEWMERYNEASMSTSNREAIVAEVEDSLENDFELVGATAIEDRLQDDVANTISVLKEAGIKIWVLTGDKIETAINIGYSCKVLNNQMEQYIIDCPNTDGIIDQIADAHRDFLKSNVTAHALVVAGDSLLKITNKPTLKDEFMRLAEKMKVVIACRVSPKQKAEIVNLVKDKYPDKTTLAIGDGANDVNMITAAHIGIGISGLEGQQAARSSDYAIGQFKFLRTLLLIHGREAYRRNAYVVGYMFYKNIMFVMTIFWFGLFCNYSGQTIFDDYLYQLYNITYSSLAIMWFAVFDHEYPKEILYKNPKYYIIGLENM
jgi:phospholipid-transporting ATPase